MKKRRLVKKLDEDDILEILIEHFQDIDKKLVQAQGILLGSPGIDLRFVGVFGEDGDSEVYSCDLNVIDGQNEFNGDHAFLKKHPEFWL